MPMFKDYSPVSLEAVLTNRRWWYRLDPFPHIVATNVFSSAFYDSLQAVLHEILGRGFGEKDDPERFSHNMPHSDAYAWNFPPDLQGPLSIFYSREWHTMLTRLTGVEATDDVNGALHHHQLLSKSGTVHRDLGLGWFSVQKRPDGINPMDLRCCSYTHGTTKQTGLEVREVVRAITMIYYFGNSPWTPGDGGETGLYRTADAAVDKPAALVPPINNSILIFENTPISYHSFICNKRYVRNSAILWLHQVKSRAALRWGEPITPSSLITSSFSNSSTGEEGGGENHPLVSCIMPTYNRRAFVPQAIGYFSRQDYANKELIIVDDGTDAVSDLIPSDQHIHYIRLSQKTTLGAKRNIACEQARGTIIAHWDDDDWHAPHRLHYQVGALLREGTDLCGTTTLLFYDADNRYAWQYVYPSGQRMWLAGGTLCYLRAFWTGNRFANINVGEDARFVWSARSGRITKLPDSTFYVATIHSHNVSPKKTNGTYWKPYPVEEIRRLLGNDWAFYQPHHRETGADLPSTTDPAGEN
jgi:hypothetical protein